MASSTRQSKDILELKISQKGQLKDMQRKLRAVLAAETCTLKP
ncbi:hypothetical protein TIFTF001_056786 [Ficus carica]|uniref:Uncharacterized protein n=1 Tax=Ficus carica TaxID=3494 RepID=A0AA88EIX3_FICCA|nr:hypothetical protein TIFTF001_056785 [Ficus carica]GMN75540.1 hypothetical protein TIFTF001_056786 [Ficus carica]